MLGINLKTDLDIKLSRIQPDQMSSIDSVNVADYFASDVIPDAFKITDINAGEITDVMLRDASVTTAKLANLAVDSTKLAALAVDAAALANSAVTATKIANLAVGSAAIASSAIGTAHIANGAILNAHIQDATIQSAKILSLSADKITAGTINASVINVTNINADNITAGTIIGRTFKAIGGASGNDVWITPSGQIQFMNDTNVKSFITTGGTDSLIVNSDGDLNIYYGDAGGSRNIGIFEGSTGGLVASFDGSRNFRMESGYIKLAVRGSHPSGATAGAMYFSTVADDIVFHNGSSWYKVTATPY